MIVFVANLIPLLMINYIICFEVRTMKGLIGYTLFEMYILYLLNYG